MVRAIREPPASGIGFTDDSRMESRSAVRRPAAALSHRVRNRTCRVECEASAEAARPRPPVDACGHHGA